MVSSRIIENDYPWSMVMINWDGLGCDLFLAQSLLEIGKALTWQWPSVQKFFCQLAPQTLDTGDLAYETYR